MTPSLFKKTPNSVIPDSNTRLNLFLSEAVEKDKDPALKESIPSER